MALRIGSDLPSFEGATDWVNSPEKSIEIPNGSPVLVHFWSVSCGLCKDNLPKVAEIRDQRKNQGLNVVAVHMPRYPEDMNREAVLKAIEQYQITEACAIDDEHKLRDAFGNDHGYVPAYYVFNADGKLKGFAAGANGLSLVMPALDRVLNSASTAA